MTTPTTFRCYGHLEEGKEMTVWEAYPFEGMPQFAGWILPANGIYTGARYYLSVTLSEQRQGHDWQVGHYSSLIELEGTGGEWKTLTDPDAGAAFNQGHAGALELRGLVPEWHDEDRDCWVTLSFEYDPGLSAFWNGYSREELIDRQRQSEYLFPDEEDPDSALPDPKPEYLPTGLTKAFPDLGLELDYQGVIKSEDSTLRLPMGSRHGIVQDNVLVLLLDTDRGGVSDPDVEIPEDRNVIGVGPDGTLEWTIQEPGEYPFLSLWAQDDTVLAEGIKTWYEIAPTTGAVPRTVDYYYGRLG